MSGDRYGTALAAATWHLNRECERKLEIGAEKKKTTQEIGTTEMGKKFDLREVWAGPKFKK